MRVKDPVFFEKFGVRRRGKSCASQAYHYPRRSVSSFFPEFDSVPYFVTRKIYACQVKESETKNIARFSPHDLSPEAVPFWLSPCFLDEAIIPDRGMPSTMVIAHLIMSRVEPPISTFNIFNSPTFQTFLPRPGSKIFEQT